MAKYYPLKELTVARTREFLREPEAIFWVYIFPLILMVGLGIAFRGGGRKDLRIDITESPGSREIAKAIELQAGFLVEVVPMETARARYMTGKVDLIVHVMEHSYEFIYDPSRLGAEEAKIKVNDALQAFAGRRDPIPWKDLPITEPGSRYIDWLIPGLMGMNIMGGGLWGLGFVTVDLRMRKLLKRFVATPMRRSHFLLALIGSRLFFLLTEMAAILLAGHLIFGLSVRGSIMGLAVIVFLGCVCFGGLGLLIASRTDKIETISGLLNFVMLPMYILSGIFFSAERFPVSMQPFIQALPLTQLNNALRAVILEGASLESQWIPAVVMTAFGLAGFALALRWFRWQ